MKRLLVFMVTLMMMLGLVACGSGVPAEKTGEVDALIAKLEVLVEDTAAEVEKTNNTDYVEVQEYYDTTIQVVNEVRDVFGEIKTAWAENKDGMDEAQVDELIAQLQDLEKQTQELKQNAIDEVAAIGDAIAESEAEPEATEEAAESIVVSVEIINNTGADLYGLAMSPANTDDWGENLITEVIADGESGTGEFEFTADTLVWDLLVEDAEGNQLTFMGIDFTEANVEGARLELSATEGGDYVASFVE